LRVVVTDRDTRVVATNEAGEYVASVVVDDRVHQDIAERTCRHVATVYGWKRANHVPSWFQELSNV
jgi:hypothetical protein